MNPYKPPGAERERTKADSAWSLVHKAKIAMALIFVSPLVALAALAALIFVTQLVIALLQMVDLL